MIDWKLDETIGSHFIWTGYSEGRPIWTITNGKSPDPKAGGYFDRDAMLKLKNLESKE